jgi:hypothetical protein
MREDLTDLRQQVNTGFAEMRDFQQQVGAEFAKMRDFQQQVGVGFIEMRGKFDATAAGFQQITGLLNTVLIKRGRRSALIASSVPPTLHRCQPNPPSQRKLGHCRSEPPHRRLPSVVNDRMALT